MTNLSFSINIFLYLVLFHFTKTVQDNNPGPDVLSYECYCVRRADSGLGASLVLEHSDHQGTELETGLMSTLCHSTSKNAPSVLSQHPCVEMETQTDFGATLSATNHEVSEQSAVEGSCSGANCVNNTCTTNRCDVNEQESPKKERKERANNCFELSSQCAPPALCCDNAVNLDLMAVIDYDAETGTPVCVVDLDINPRFSW